MAESQGRTPGTTGNTPNVTSTSDDRSGKPDPDARAGDPKSVGAESVRDGRPATDSGTVEAIDEAGPGVTPPLAGRKNDQ